MICEKPIPQLVSWARGWVVVRKGASASQRQGERMSRQFAMNIVGAVKGEINSEIVDVKSCWKQKSTGIITRRCSR